MRFGFDDSKWLIEPRAKSGGGYATACWLVVKNKLTGKYLTVDGGKAYIQFRNSDSVAEYINRLEKTEGGTI